MTIMSDNWIKKMSLEREMISPFVDGQKKDGTISYGVSSYGYDARVSEEFKIFTNVDSAIVDPKNFSDKGFVKLNIGLGKGKKKYDKREDQKSKDWNKNKQRLLKNN